MPAARQPRDHVRASRPRFPVSAERGRQIAEAFYAATRGGEATATRGPVAGIEEVLRLHPGLARFFAAKPSRLVRPGLINGLPGFVTVEGDGTLQATAPEIDRGRIVGIDITRNPYKPCHLGPEGSEGD